MGRWFRRYVSSELKTTSPVFFTWSRVPRGEPLPSSHRGPKHLQNLAHLLRRWVLGGCQGGLTTEFEDMGEEP